MGIMVKKDEDKNNQLTERINADLLEKASMISLNNNDEPDAVEESEYVKDLKKTSQFGWVWVVLIILALISLIFIFMM